MFKVQRRAYLFRRLLSGYPRRLRIAWLRRKRVPVRRSSVHGVQPHLRHESWLNYYWKAC